MKKTFLSILILALFAVPVITHAQSKPLFQFFSSEKATISPTPIQPSEPAPTEITEATLDLAALRNQPLPIRRKMVATELDGIWTRLDILSEKTMSATVRLGDNGIDIAVSITKLDEAATSLAQARLTIDSIVTAANDPASVSAVTLMVGTATFKETVIKAEDELRAAREAIIASLAELKIAVSAKVTPAE